MLKPHTAAKDIDRAVRSSVFSPLESSVVATLLRDSVMHHYTQGAVVTHIGDEAVMGLVLRGLLRSFVETPDGWQLTVRYSRRGDLFGLLAIDSRQEMTGIQAIHDSVILAFDGRRVVQMASQDSALAWLLAREAASRLGHAYRELVFQARAPLDARLARELLARAISHTPTATPEIVVQQEELAEAIGTAREVIGRTLRRMRQDGLIRTRPGRITLLDPERLQRTYLSEPA